MFNIHFDEIQICNRLNLQKKFIEPNNGVKLPETKLN